MRNWLWPAGMGTLVGLKESLILPAEMVCFCCIACTLVELTVGLRMAIKTVPLHWFAFSHECISFERTYLDRL